MNILAFDTSTELCSAALLCNGDLVVREALAGNRHSELLLPMLHELLDEAGLRLQELDGLAFGKGPGSFTGLRIGCGVAQGLAFAADLPVLGVITLEAMALAAGAEHVLTCIDARMHEVYAGAYRVIGTTIEVVTPPAVLPPDAFTPAGDQAWVGCGTGFLAYPDKLGGKVRHVVPAIYPHAREIARLALPCFARGEGQAAELAEPYYIRDKVALKICER